MGDFINPTVIGSKKRPLLGRTIHILFFKQNICFINVHPGHDDGSGITTDRGKDNVFLIGAKIHNTFNRFGDVLNELLPKDPASRLKYEIKLQTYKIIIAGDFNKEKPVDNVNNLDIFKKRNFNIETTEHTCCRKSIDDIALSPSNKPVDHILTTLDNSAYREVLLKSEPNNSDHLPVYGVLNSTTPVTPPVTPPTPAPPVGAPVAPATPSGYDDKVDIKIKDMDDAVVYIATDKSHILIKPKNNTEASYKQYYREKGVFKLLEKHIT